MANLGLALQSTIPLPDAQDFIGKRTLCAANPAHLDTLKDREFSDAVHIFERACAMKPD